MLTMTPVTGSAQVAEDGYDAEARVLAVRYKSSEFVYRYEGVPAEVAMAYDQAPSKGSFLAKNVKGKFKFEPPPATK